MKLSEFRQGLSLRLRILRASLVFTFQQETAYWTENWANVLSTFFYTVSMILFINIMYSNTDLIAGYNRNEMLLFLFVGQFGFYLSGWLYYSILPSLIRDVNNGSLDFVLVKPVPSLFYVTFRELKVFTIIRDGLPPMVALGLYMNWAELNLSAANFFVGFVIVFLGIMSAHVFHFLFTIPVFWLGESSNLLDMSGHFEHNVGKTVPFEGFGIQLRTLFTTFIPVLISTGVATSVMLGKSRALPMLTLSALVALSFLVIMNVVWKLALRSYSSASS